MVRKREYTNDAERGKREGDWTIVYVLRRSKNEAAASCGVRVNFYGRLSSLFTMRARANESEAIRMRTLFPERDILSLALFYV